MVSWITLPGLTNYTDCLNLMQISVEKVLNDKTENVVILTEHNDIYTYGISSDNKELVSNINIPVIYTNRGGKLTYHGPGQRIIYHIINLSHIRDIKKYIDQLQNWIIETLKNFDIKSYPLDGYIGVWTELDKVHAKIASIGIRVKKWVAFHGCAVNINTDLTKFEGIIPCGIPDCVMTSCQAIKKDISFSQFDEKLRQEYYKFF